MVKIAEKMYEFVEHFLIFNEYDTDDTGHTFCSVNMMFLLWDASLQKCTKLGNKKAGTVFLSTLHFRAIVFNRVLK